MIGQTVFYFVYLCNMFGTMRFGTGSRRHSRHGQMIEEEEKEFKDTPNYFIKNYFYTAQQG